MGRQPVNSTPAAGMSRHKGLIRAWFCHPGPLRSSLSDLTVNKALVTVYVSMGPIQTWALEVEMIP